jgi:capsular polysaccharide transport system permease protein
MADRSLLPPKWSAVSTLASVKNSILLTLSRFDNSSSAWQMRFSTLRKPRSLISLFLASSAFYCFVIGRDRYTSISEFVIQRANPPQAITASVLSGGVVSPQVLAGLVDGQYLQVYLGSPEVKNRIYADPTVFEKKYEPSFPDIFSGLPRGSSPPSQLSFYRKQLQVSPQPLSGCSDS